MAGTNDFLPLADGPGDNVVTQGAYVTLLGGGGALAAGYLAGTAKSAQVNKTLRQATKIASAVAGAMASLLNENVTDADGNTAALQAQFIRTLQAASKSIILTAQVFDGAVVNGNAVRWNAGTTNWHQAIADGTTNDESIGFADVTNSLVYLFGLVPALLSGLTPGARYYLSSSAAGAITATPPAVDVIYVGIAKSATDLYADFDPGAPVPVAVVGDSRGLVITNNAGTPNTKIDCAATEIVVKTAGGTPFLITNWNNTIDATTNGANGLDVGGLGNSTYYYEHAIYNPTTATKAALLSLSATAPTLPSGYTFSALAGSCQTDVSGHIKTFTQLGRAVYIADVNMFTALAATNPNAYQIFNAAAFVPPIAKTISGTMGSAGGVNALMTMAGDINGIGAQQVNNASGTLYDSFQNACAYAGIPLKTAQNFYWKCGDTAARNRVNLSAYTI